ncbi:10783_t:CDS:1 [Acaulospora colombiana]|uniref:10783_t:CDS:1 n=1 Tax=Acaulospora colombiana TaxID=27376 RepID=A0ACA9LSE6_9GLOM|nr:10783_t:CDS:1 [Acaulospora colombiana]
MAATLPDLCFEEIFSHFKYDYSILYKCLLINRVWCRNAVPHLWRCPFRQSLPTLNAHHLIRTYISCLDDTELSLLSSYGLIVTEKNAAFEYGRYLEELSFCYLNDAIHSWMVFKVDFWNYETISRPVSTAICHMFMRQRAKVKNVKLSCHEMTIGKFPEPKAFSDNWRGLNKVRSLELCIDRYCLFNKSEFPLGFLFQVVKSCTSISHMRINMNYNCHKLLSDVIGEIIRVQRNLEEFVLSETLSVVTASIVYALESQTHSLTSLRFNNVIFGGVSLHWLERCKKLRTLSLLKCSGQMMELNLSYITFPIKNLELVCDRANTRATKIAEIIRNVGENLETLKLNIVDRSTMNAISVSCPNLEILDVEVPEEMYAIAKLWIGNLALKTSNLHCEDTYSDDDEMDTKYIV